MKTLATLILSCIAATTYAGTMTFSGVITNITIHDGDFPDYYSDVKKILSIADTFSGRLDFSADHSHWTLLAEVGGFPFYGDQDNTYGFSLSADARTLYFYPFYQSMGGSDGLFFISPTTLFAFAADHIIIEDWDRQPSIGVEGTVTKQNVTIPDTGSTLALFTLGALALALFRLKRLAALLALCCIAATTTYAGSISFSGIVTNVRLDPEFAYFNTTKVGDKMTGHVDFNDDFTLVTASVGVEGASRGWSLSVGPYTNSHFWFLSVEPFSLGYEAEWIDGYWGTDASFGLEDGYFTAYSVDGSAYPDYQYGIASGVVTNIHVPDTGSTVALFVCALVGLALAQLRWRNNIDRQRILTR